ncbi:MAG TPA: PfkB family carbohydrate kinase [Anaerolineae bacterium]|nr:PfkB family carbohydrate kinase [Anaerolineae bacterium]
MQYLAIGHVCHDILPGGRVLGGTVTFSALTALALGWRAAIVTRAHPAIDLAPLRPAECVCLPDAATTTFENIYSPAGRVQILHAVAGPIRTIDLPARLRRAEVIHLAPIANEVDPALVGAFDDALIGVTPQGWLRQWDASGRVAPRTWTEAEAILNHVDAAVLSIDDVDGDWAQIERWAALARVFVVTQGRAGCTVYVHGARAQVPAPPVSEVDSTGAGDIFAAAFFMRLKRSGDAVLAARFANCIAARSVTRRGLDSVPTPPDVVGCEKRATV